MSEKIIFKDKNDLTNGNMVVIDSGKLDIYNKIGGVRQKTSSLNTTFTGSAYTNQWTTIGGLWQEKPTVILSPKSIPSYYSGWQMSSQRFALSNEVQLVSEGTYRLYPSFIFYADSNSSSASPNLVIYGTDGDSSSPSGVVNPLADCSTPFYVCQGGVVNVNFGYRMDACLQDGYNQRVIHYYFTTYIYLDVSRGHTITSHLVASRAGGYPDYEISASASVDVGAGLCQWRLRKVSVMTGRSGSLNWEARANNNYLRLSSYSFGFAQTQISPTDSEVYYLAVGR